MVEEIKLNCTCLSEKAKWGLIGVLNTALMLGRRNISGLEKELEEKRRIGAEIPAFQKMALQHLKSDIEVSTKLKKEVERIPICR